MKYGLTAQHNKKVIISFIIDNFMTNNFCLKYFLLKAAVFEIKSQKPYFRPPFFPSGVTRVVSTWFLNKIMVVMVYTKFHASIQILTMK